MALFLLIMTLFSAHASGLVMYERAVNLFEERYLRLDELDPAEAFRQAAEQAEASVPWLIVEPDGLAVTLRNGHTGATHTIHMVRPDTSPGIRQLSDALERLELAIMAMDAPIPDDVDLPVVLLRGVCRALDRNSVILHKSRLDRFDQRIKGKLTGIGSRLEVESGELVVAEVFVDGPAEIGGLQAGDVILRVDGVSTLGMSLRQSVDRIRGPKKSEVELLVRRRIEDGTDQELELVFIRDQIDIPNVSWNMGDDGVGVIEIDHFSEHTSRLTAEALSSFVTRSADEHPLVGVILDLRGNSGGSMIQAAETVDLFVENGVLVETAGRNGEPVPNLLQRLQAHPAEGALKEPDVPIVVLQNHRSASASEIVAGALRELDRGTIIGTTSFGKGTVQKLYTLRSGKDRVRLKLTVAEYQLTGGIPVHGEGLEPDLVLRRVIFNRSGAWVPLIDEQVAPVVLDVAERPGWRKEGTADLDADPLLEIARRLLIATGGASRADGLDAIDRLGPSIVNEAESRVVETFRERELDWAATDDQAGILDVDVVVEVLGLARSGERVDIRAELTNNGPAPLYRARVRLSADSRRLPWHNVTIPIGFVPPGEAATGTTQVAIPVRGPSREDAVDIQLEADGLDPVEMEPVMFAIDGQPVPDLAAEVTLVPEGEHHRVEVVLENLSDITISGIETHFAWRENSGVELLDRKARLPALGPEERARVDLAMKLLEAESDEPIHLELRVDAERFQEVLRIPVLIARDGTTQRVQSPIIDLEAPVVTMEDMVDIRIKARDDTAITSVAVWWNSEKHSWMPGDGRKVQLTSSLPMESGSNRLVVVVKDGDGNEVRKTHYVWGGGAKSADATADDVPAEGSGASSAESDAH